MTLISALLAHGAGRGPRGTVIVTAAVLLGQLSVGWSNDWVDARLDTSHGRKDKPIASGRVSRPAVGAAAIAALVLCVPLSLAAGVRAGIAHLVAVAAAYAYNAGLKRTPLSVLPYALAFGLLPAFITLGPPPSHVPAAWAVLASASAGAGAHFVQVIPDIARDRASGLLGLPQLLGERASAAVGAGLLAVAATAVAVGAPSPPVLAASGVTALLIAGVFACVLRGRYRLAFRLTLAAAALVAAAVVAGGGSF